MYKCIIEQNEQLTPTTQLLTLRYAEDESKILGYHSGQYAAISFRHKGRLSHARCFSIASSPSDLDILQFGIRVQGRFTRAIRKLEPGERIDIRGPYGGFVLAPGSQKDLIFAAGGIGITPLMSMLRYLKATNFPYHVRLLYGVQSQDDIPFIDELRQMAQAMPNLHITYAVSKGDITTLAGLDVVQSRVDGALLHDAIAGQPQNKTLYICGPPPFMNSLVEAAKVRGIPKNQIITEAFKQGPARQTGKVISWPRNMYVLGGLGVVVGAFAVMVGDIVHNLPKAQFINASLAQRQLRTGNQRSSDLDALVNTFADEDETGKTDSPAATNALNAVAAADAANAAATAANNTATPTPTTTTKLATPTPAPAPAPAPAPKCTTTQSGVTTCI